MLFEWKSAEVSQRGQGMTRDISIKGMFIYSDDELPVSANLDLDLALGPLGEKNTVLRMSAKATVLRVEHPTEPGAPKGFAVINRSYKLQAGTNLIENQNWNND